MYKVSLPLLLCAMLVSHVLLAESNTGKISQPKLPREASDPLAVLGTQLFFDPNLSLHRNQSCATCHAPSHAFTDNRDNGVGGMASLGSDDISLGDRNTPTASYAALAPTFRVIQGEYIGGFFHDGRAIDLAEQAAGPPLNPIEMAFASKEQVVDRLLENEVYKGSFVKLFGDKVFDDPELAYEKMTQAIMAFEQTELFMPFDSKYDRYLRGEVKLTQEEELGKVLFFSEQFTNCNQCHQLSRSPIYAKETFTNYKYHNIGVPENHELREKNNVSIKDVGLLAHPNIDSESEKGKFKVPTLRNVAVTPPYMHNGIFKDLKTVVLFYDKYNNPARKINPETDKPWASPEIPDNLDLEKLESGPALDERRVNALVAFLKTLTDKRYEPLLEESN